MSLLYNFVCAEYFEVGRSNILYSACFFLAGGLIYLYRKELARISPYIAVALAVASIVAYYLIGSYAMTCLLVSACLLICTIVVRGGGGTGEPHYPILQQHQHGNLPVSHGAVPRD